ncbi:MAG: hypothetical protein ABSC23_03785 [Bryobacteraceae bacterium]|jgi:hypothetical protein
MKHLRNILVCALLAVLIASVVYGMLCIRAATAVISAVPGQVQAAQSALIQEVQATRRDLMGQVDAARKDASSQLTALQSNVFAQVDQTRAAVDRRVGDSLTRVDAALGTVDQLRADLQPVLTSAAAAAGHVNSITAHVDDALPQFTDCAYVDADGTPIGGNPDCVFNRFQGMSRAFENAAVDVSATTHDFRGAIPSVIADVKRASDGSARASESTAQVMANFAKATKPLPTWARIGLAVAPPVAQLGVSIATTLAVTGKVGK